VALSLEREPQGLRLTLAERDHSLERLRSDLARVRKNARDPIDEVASTAAAVCDLGRRVVTTETATA